MALLLFVAINNHNNLQLVCQALVDDEIAETHIWILKYTLLITGGIKQSNRIISGGLIPLVFMIDSNSTVNAACIKIYQDCYTMHCIYHIGQIFIKSFQNY